MQALKTFLKDPRAQVMLASIVTSICIYISQVGGPYSKTIAGLILTHSTTYILPSPGSKSGG